MIRALIVDDEPLAVEKIRLFAASESDLEIIGTCANGKEALAAYRTSSFWIYKCRRCPVSIFFLR